MESTQDHLVESYKLTLTRILYDIPPWIKKDPNFTMQAARDDINLLHWKYHDEMLSFTKWAEIYPRSLEMKDR